MLDLREYRNNPDRLSDLLPWAALVAPGVVLNKDGSFQSTLRYRGPDLDSATEAELVATSARLNNILKRLGSGWALYIEAQRRRAASYPTAGWQDPVSYLIDEERRILFEGNRHFESTYYLTLVYLPPSDSANRLASCFLDSAKSEGVNYRKLLEAFQSEAKRVTQLLEVLFPEVSTLSSEETLTYLHSLISTKCHSIKIPGTAMYLDAYLPDTTLTPGFEPRLGTRHLRMISISGFPGKSQPGLLDCLNRLAIEYRWVTRFICLDKTEALTELNGYKRRWFAKRKGIITLLKEVLTNSESIMSDTDASNKALDADAAVQELSDDAVSYGYFTGSIVLAAETPQAANAQASEVERAVNSLGFTTKLEDVNAVDAWLGTLPGNCRNNVRRPILNTLNTARKLHESSTASHDMPISAVNNEKSGFAVRSCTAPVRFFIILRIYRHLLSLVTNFHEVSGLSHLMPLSAVWAGPADNAYFKAPPLLYALTNGSTPFRLVTHVGDVGHTLVLGPSGAGKSVLLNVMEAQFLRYPDAQVYIFDKGGSARALTAGLGGDYYDLGADDAELAFQPLASVDNEADRRWAHEWLLEILTQENVTITPALKEELWKALSSLASAKREERTVFGLTLLLQNDTLRQALLPYTLQGAHGRLLDNTQDNLQYGRWQCFEMEVLMETPSVIMPVLSYLFHRLEQRFTGRPTMLVLDEAWLFLDHPAFAAKIREWLKVLRKANVMVVFATQSLADIDQSSIAATIKEACFTKIYLPNANALSHDSAGFYERFGLNSRQIEILALATPKRDYYYTSPLGNRLFELGLGGVALTYCAGTSKEQQAAVKAILKRATSTDEFNSEFLRSRGLAWAAELINQQNEMSNAA